MDAKLISDVAYLGGNAVAWVAYLYVGLRLYMLGLHTHQLPERLIAVSFLFWVFSYICYDFAYAITRVEELVPAACSYASLIALSCGNVAFACFVRSVFRPRERWAKWLVAAIVASLVAGVAGSAWIGDWEGVNPVANPWYWLEYFGGLAPYVWMGSEGFAQYLKARLRMKIGLCEPTVCNRFLLWGIAGTLWLLLEVVRTSNDFVLALTGQWSDLLNIGVAVCEVVPVAFVWLIFFPPAFYRRWVEGRGELAAAAPPTVR